MKGVQKSDFYYCEDGARKLPRNIRRYLSIPTTLYATRIVFSCIYFYFHLTFSLTVNQGIHSSGVSCNVAWYRATNISEDFYRLLCKDKKDMRAEPPSQTVVTLCNIAQYCMLQRSNAQWKTVIVREFRLQITRSSLTNRGKWLITSYRQFTCDEHRFIIAHTLDGTQANWHPRQNFY